MGFVTDLLTYGSGLIRGVYTFGFGSPTGYLLLWIASGIIGTLINVSVELLFYESADRRQWNRLGFFAAMNIGVGGAFWPYLPVLLPLTIWGNRKGVRDEPRN